MLVKNVSAKPIGFGSVAILPDETKTLPDGFDEKHPTVRFYLTCEPPILQKADGSTITPPAQQQTGEQPQGGAETPPAGTGTVQTNVSVPAHRTPEEVAAIEAAVKALEPLKLAELQEKAAELGIPFGETDTKAILKQKITDKYQAE